jgi:nicotinamidase-related amidase
MKLLDSENTGLVVVDVQERLMQAVGQKERVIANIIKLLHLSALFNLPVILTEHYLKAFGPTLSEITECLPSYEPIQKIVFNCCEVDAFNERLDSAGLKKIILTGVESHICIFQTCVPLLEKGYQVHVPLDAVDSRTDENRRVGLRLMEKAGAFITSTETIIYQILKRGGTREFKEMLQWIK